MAYTIQKIVKGQSAFKDLLRIKDLTIILERDRRTIYRYIKDGILPKPVNCYGKYPYFDPKTVQQYIQRNFMEAPPESPFTMRPSH